MKIIVTLFSCFFIIITQSQELKTIELLPPESKENKDLLFLKNELQGKQFVMLGEHSHMYGNIFEMKVRVVEYLHQELGFNVIAMESSMYDIWKMNLKGFNSKDFNNAIWDVWSNSYEFQRLVEYIEKNNLTVIGFDSQVINTYQFVEDFFKYCDDNSISLKLDKDEIGIIIEDALEYAKLDEYDISYADYEEEIQQILQQIEKLETNETNYYWKQFVKCLLACSQDAYYNKTEFYSLDFGDKTYNIRDKQMADNLLSYIRRNPTEKIIVWADNIHVQNDNSSVNKPNLKEFVSMGVHLKKELKNNMYSLATIHSNDSLFNSKTKKWSSTPIDKSSFEYELDLVKQPYLFISSDQEGMKRVKKTRLLNFIDFTEARLDQLHDGYIFFQHATIPKREIENMIGFGNEAESLKKISTIEAGKNVILKGQIIDKTSNEPVPFATLVLKKEEIYRVADENGFYEIPINKVAFKTAVVEISSVGFVTQTQALKGLNERTFLKPKYEQLKGVTLIGYISPKTILKKALNNKKINHPVDPFNYFRYGKVLINKNDKNELDLELITKDYDQGYLSPFIITQRVEQIKWNKCNDPKKYKNSSQFFAYRQNAIQYATILHKRKYKKFKLNFVSSNEIEDEGLYVISFQTDRDKWNFTNRGYPTVYSGRVYVNKESFAIVKVIENWETVLNRKEIVKHFKGYESYKNIIQTTIKEENICYYSDVLNNGKFYANRYYNRTYHETINFENKKEHKIIELDSYLFDLELADVEEIEFEYRKMDKTVLNRVEYDEIFWNNFYKKINKK